MPLCVDDQLDLFRDAVPSGEWTHRVIAADHAAMRAPLAVAGLFAGIGGFELGLGRAGHHTQLLCENDPGAVEVLRRRFPRIALHEDVRTLGDLPAGTDLVAAGFPCQDLSQAGRTAGIAGAQSSLIHALFDLLRRRRVPWVLIENVSFMLRLAQGRALAVIVEELESLGYRWAYRVVDSLAFGLPQRRQRIFLLASLDEDPCNVLFADDAGPLALKPEAKHACGFYWTEGIRGLGWAHDAIPTLKGGSTVGIPSPPAILMPSREVVTPDIRDAERLQGFPPGWTEPAEAVKRRGHRWKLVGNAVTVDAAHWIALRLRRPGLHDGRGDQPIASDAPWPLAAWGDRHGRFRAMVSLYPVQCDREPLHRFLRFPASYLSTKATAGFLSRARVSRLRFPPGFLDSLEVHLDRVRGHDNHLREDDQAWVDDRCRDLGASVADTPAGDLGGADGPANAPSHGQAISGEQPGFAW